jgi:hypothetical protein
MTWKTIPSYPNYEASEDGKIRRAKNERELKPKLDDREYLSLVLYTNGKKYSKRIARLIWEAFNGCQCKQTVDHIDRNKVNNHISNLRCVSHKENSKNRDNYSNNTNKYGLTEEKKIELIMSYKNGETTSYKIYKEYGIPSNYFFCQLMRYNKKNNPKNDSNTIRKV